MMHPPHDHASRRSRALDRLGRHGALVLPAAPEVVIGRDTDVPYVPDANLFYLTGCVAPETVAVLAPDADEGPFILFARERDAERERWTGPRESPEAMGERLGADSTFPIAELAERLPRLLAGHDAIHFPIGWGRPDVERIVLDSMIAGRRSRQRRGRGPHALVDPGAILDDLRIRKDDAEIARLREAARISVLAFRDARERAGAGIREAQVQAAVEHGFRSRGAAGPAFPSIVAAGANATVLHYTANAGVIAPGDLLLLDAGATFDHYHADISRTWAAAGPATDAQREMHAVVMNAHAAAIRAVRPGATEADVHRAALGRLVHGMRDLGLLGNDVDVDALLQAHEANARTAEPPARKPGTRDAEKAAFLRWFPHRVSHWLGLEVHDVGDYALDDQPRRLEPGMVLTIEPGLYVPDMDDAPGRLRGLGIRVEDDVLVTNDGAEVLTADLPTDLV